MRQSVLLVAARGQHSSFVTGLRRSLGRLASVAVLLLLAGQAAADGECSATCSCVCTEDYGECLAICTTGYYAQCMDGFCGGGRARCCCKLQGPLQGSSTCGGQDCGDWPTFPCASNRSRPEKGACLDLLGARSEEARWLLVESTPIPGERDHRLAVLFSSTPELKQQVEDCQAEGLLPDSMSDGGPTRTFTFIAPRRAFDLAGRRVRLEIPEDSLPKRSGELALTLVVDALGAVQSKELLFATEEMLGQEILERADDWLRVRQVGNAPGPFLDSIYVVVRDGIAAVQIVNSYSFTKAPPKAPVT